MGFLSLMPTLSLQLAKFSEDTLSSYTEAVSSQVNCRDRDFPLGPCRHMKYGVLLFGSL